MTSNPAALFFEVVRRADWSVTDCVFHLVDNALDAGARHVWVYIRPGASPRDTSVEVVDDGAGMDDAGIRLALSLGSSPTHAGALGAFGLGMKAAAVALGERLDVLSAPGRGAPFRKRVVRFDAVRTSGQYTAADEPLGVEDSVLVHAHLPGGRGTLARVGGVSLGPSMGVQAALAVLSGEAGIVYASFLLEGFSLQIGGKTVYGVDPLRTKEADEAEGDGTSNGYRWLLRSRRLLLDPDARLYGALDVTQRLPASACAFPRLMDRPEHDGLYVYRNRRLIAKALRPAGLPVDDDGGASGFRGRLSVDGTADDALGLELRKAVSALPEEAEAALCRVILPLLTRAANSDVRAGARSEPRPGPAVRTP